MKTSTRAALSAALSALDDVDNFFTAKELAPIYPGIRRALDLLNNELGGLQ